MKRIAVLQGAEGSVSAVLAQQACPCTGNRQCKAAERHCQRSKQAGAGLRQGVSVLHSGIRVVGGQNRGVRRIGPCVLYRSQLRVFRGDGGIRAGLRVRFRVGVRVGSVGPVRVRGRRGQLRMSGFQGKAIASSFIYSDSIQASGLIVIDGDAIGQFIQTVKEGLSRISVSVEIPTRSVGIDIPAVDLMTAVGAVRALVQNITDACIAYGEGQLAARLNKDVGACQRSTVVVDRGVCTQLCGCTVANDQTAALLGQIFLRATIFLCGIVVGNGNIGSVLNGKLTAAVAEDAGHIIVFDSYSAVLDRQACVTLHEPQTGIPIRFALCTGNGDGGVIADFSFAGEDDARQTVIFSSNSGVLHSQIAGRQAVRTVAAEVDVRAVFDVIVRTVRAVAAAIDDFYITFIYRYIEGAGKAGTVMVGDEGGTAGNIAVVAPLPPSHVKAFIE